MRKFKKPLIICVLFLSILSSCSKGDGIKPTTPTQVPPPLTATENATVTVLPTRVNYQFPSRGTPDPVEKIYNDPGQITDGQLKLSIFEANRQCHRLGTNTELSPGKFTYKFGDLIPVIFTFENLTDKPLKIADYNFVGVANQVNLDSSAEVVPILNTLDGQHITTGEEAQSIGYRLHQTPTFALVRELPGKASFNTTINYFPPIQVLYFDESGQLSTMEIPPGRYLLKYVYGASGYQGSWRGMLSSNQIEICVFN